jgi:hypothetical protein
LVGLPEFKWAGKVAKFGSGKIGDLISGFRSSSKGYSHGNSTFRSAAEFEASVSKLAGNSAEKKALITDVMRQVANANEWKKATELSGKTSRGEEFYKVADGQYVSIDFQHGHFEMFTGKPGKLQHQGSINIDGFINKGRNQKYDISY